MSTNARVNKPLRGLPGDGAQLAHSAATSPIAEAMMRLGYMVRGLLYVIIGILAFQVAIGTGGAFDDPQGAIAKMGATPFGSIVLYIILIGLIGYSLWGFVRALFDPLHKGSDLKGIATRIGFAVSGVSYGLLAWATYGLITGAVNAARNGAQGAQTQHTAAGILANSWGPYVVGLAGVIVVAIGLSQLVQGVRGDFDARFQPYALNASQRLWIDRMGRFGVASRGIVFAIIGVFLFLAAYNNDPKQAQGIDGALSTILHQPYGPWLLGIVALGLIAFGIYSALGGLWLRLKR